MDEGEVVGEAGDECVGEVVEGSAPEHVGMWKLLLLSLVQFAVQFMYSAQYAVANPIESRLGLPHWSWPIINSADPIVGVIVQPVVGYYSDRCESRFGRRRPFIIAGAAVAIAATVLMALVESMLESPRGRRGLFITFLVLYNIGLNGMQAPAEALMQDVLRPDQLTQGQSVASCLVAVSVAVASLPGAVVGLASSSSFQPTTVVLVVVGFVITGAIGVGCFVSKEKQYRAPAEQKSGGPFRAYREVGAALVRMTPSMWLTLAATFLAVVSYTPFQIVITDLCGVEVYGGNAEFNPEPYRRGVGFGMMITVVSSAVALLYCLWQDKVVARFGIGRTLAATFALSAIGFFPPLFTANRWVLLVFLALCTMNFVAIQSLAYVVVERATPQNEGCVYIGLLDVSVELACVTGLLAFQLGVGSRWESRRPTLFCGAPVALLGFVVCLFLDVPQAKVEDDGGEESNSSSAKH